MTEVELSTRVHDLKCWPREFRAVVDGEKTFEVRINDRDYQVGDVLILQEWQPGAEGLEGEYTGRRQTAVVTYVYTGNARGDPIKLLSGDFSKSGVAVMAISTRLDVGQ